MPVETCATPPPPPPPTSTPAPTRTPEPTSSATPTATVMPAPSRTHVNAYLHPHCCPHPHQCPVPHEADPEPSSHLHATFRNNRQDLQDNRPELPKHPKAKWHPHRTRPTPRLRGRLSVLPPELHSHGRPHRNHHSSQTTKTHSPSKPARITTFLAPLG